MRVEKVIEVAGRKVTVHELTVAELERWVEEGLDPQQPVQTSVVRGGIISGLSLQDIARLSDITVEQMEEMTPSQVQVIGDACVEANRHFFALLDRIERSIQRSSTPAS